MATWTGGWTGNDYGAFRVVLEAWTENQTESGATVHWRRYLQVEDWIEGTISTSMGDVWVDQRSGTNNYAIQDTTEYRNYGQSSSWSVYADIYPYSGGHWESGTSGSYAPDVPTWAPKAPTSVSASVSGTSVTVKWTRNPTTPRPYSSQTVYYKTSSASSWTAVSVGAGDTSKTISGLTNNTTYNFKVRATNSASSTDSGTVNATIAPLSPTAPSGVTATVSGTSVTVKWTRNPTSTKPYASQKVQYKLSSSSSWTDVSVGASDTSKTITGLTNNSTYNFRVIATNSAGSGTSSTVNASIAPLAPSAPTNALVTRNSDTKNTVSWTNNITSTKPYASITIQRATNGGSYESIKTGIASSTTSYQDTTTAANNSYSYKVVAVNATSSATSNATAVVYNTPCVPSSITVARKTNTTVVVSLTNDARTATALEYQRSTDKATWSSSIVVSGAKVTTFDDDPGGGTFYYRVRNTRGTLVSDWSSVSDSVVTICPPNPPTLVAPASSAIVKKSESAIVFSWRHNPVDGSAQTSAELAYSTDGGSTYTTKSLTTEESCTVGNGFAINDIVTWRVRTKGVDESFGEWSSTQSFSVYAEPVVSIVLPVAGFTVENMPINFAYSVDDKSGSNVEAILAIFKDGVTVFEKNIGTATEYVVHADEFLPADKTSYSVKVSIRSSSTLNGSGSSSFNVSFDTPKYGSIETALDESNGALDILVSQVEESSHIETDHIDVYRVVDGTRMLIGQGLSPNTTITDKYAPLNTNYVIEVAVYAESGAYSLAEFPIVNKSSYAYLVWEGGAARIMYSPSLSGKISRPSRSLVYYWGREKPVRYDSGHVESSKSWGGVVLERTERRAFERFMHAGGSGVFKSLEGDVSHSVADYSYERTYGAHGGYEITKVTLDIQEVDGVAL